MVAPKLGVKHITASEWLNPLSSEKTFLTKQDHIDGLTTLAAVELQKNPNACLDYLKSAHDLSQPCLIEGVRNPRDFINLVDLQRDVLVFLNRRPNPHQPSLFDRGAVVISDYVNWTAKNNLSDKEKRVNFIYEIGELSNVVEDFVKWFNHKGWCVLCGEVGCLHQRGNSKA